MDELRNTKIYICYTCNTIKRSGKYGFFNNFSLEGIKGDFVGAPLVGAPTRGAPHLGRAGTRPAPTNTENPVFWGDRSDPASIDQQYLSNRQVFLHKWDAPVSNDVKNKRIAVSLIRIVQSLDDGKNGGYPMEQKEYRSQD